MTEDGAMVAFVRDHLTGRDVPVHYIFPGTETRRDELAALEALALSARAAEAELDAMNAGVLECVNDYGREQLGEDWFARPDEVVWDHVEDAMWREAGATAALADTALELTRGSLADA